MAAEPTARRRPLEPASARRATETFDRIGARLRLERERQSISVRELSRRVGVSPSLLSQMERGLVRPSVRTLYSVVSVLDLSLDELFSDEQPGGGSAGTHAADGAAGRAAGPAGKPSPVQRGDARQAITLGGGVRWERLTSAPDQHVEFIRGVYPVGAETCPESALMRHGGKEYTFVQSGTLGITVGFETHVLEPGDSISFESTVPHRLYNAGEEEPVVVISAVIGRHDDWRPELTGEGKRRLP